MDQKTTGLSVGIVGCGMIMPSYYKSLSNFDWIQIRACADLDKARAEDACSSMEKEGIKKPAACTTDEMFDRDDVDLIINLTNPKAHFELNKKALLSGKHVYSEKPLTVIREEGLELLTLANEHKLLLGCATDTFLGSGHQAVRKLIDEGTIGTPTAVTLFVAGSGPDGYHVKPHFFYQAGGGPMLDVGVYYLTTIIQSLGPVKRVNAMTKTTFAKRTVLTEGPYKGEEFNVEVPTHVSGSLEFKNGAIGTIITSWDMRGGHTLPAIEIHGTKGSIRVPDPNAFDGTPRLMAAGEAEKGWQDVDTSTHMQGYDRGVGAVDLLSSLKTGRTHRASGSLAYHVLDVALSLYDAADSGKTVDVNSTVERPIPLPQNMNKGEWD